LPSGGGGKPKDESLVIDKTRPDALCPLKNRDFFFLLKAKEGVWLPFHLLNQANFYGSSLQTQFMLFFSPFF
jgi:hypothetical protein